MSESVVKPKGKQGFASMSPEKRREIASKGGKSVPAEKRSFSQSTELAASAGSIGGRADRPRAFDDRQLAIAAGRKGGQK